MVMLRQQTKGKTEQQERAESTDFSPLSVLQLKQQLAGLPYDEQMKMLRPSAPLQFSPSSGGTQSENHEEGESEGTEHDESSATGVDRENAPGEEWRENLLCETLGPFRFKIGVQPFAEIAVTTEREFINRFGTQFAIDIELVKGCFVDGFLEYLRATPHMEMATINNLGAEQEQLVMRRWGILFDVGLISLPDVDFLGGNGFSFSALIDWRKDAFMRFYPDSEDGSLYWGEGVYEDQPIPQEWYDRMYELGYSEGIRFGAELSVFDFLGGPDLTVGFLGEMDSSDNWPLTGPPEGLQWYGGLDFGTARILGDWTLAGYRRYASWSVTAEVDISENATVLASIGQGGDTGWENQAEWEGRLGFRFALGSGPPVIDSPLYPDELSLRMGWQFMAGPVGDLNNFGENNLHLGWNLGENILLGFDVNQKIVGAWMTKAQEDSAPWFNPLQAEMLRINLTEAQLNMLFRLNGANGVDRFLGFRVATGSDYEYEAGVWEMENNEGRCATYTVIQPFYAVRIAELGELRIEGPRVDVGSGEIPTIGSFGFQSARAHLTPGITCSFHGQASFQPGGVQGGVGATIEFPDTPFGLEFDMDSVKGASGGVFISI